MNQSCSAKAARKKLMKSTKSLKKSGTGSTSSSEVKALRTSRRGKVAKKMTKTVVVKSEGGETCETQQPPALVKKRPIPKRVPIVIPPKFTMDYNNYSKDDISDDEKC
ncbi:hypothetical protein EIN_175610 [Entamoeba invadens IP1]|uniref:hypothetical protein n=1 Tax=Entamoeba invadens IP1 TaxID=370355 RepID=UPI0002C3F953|nr:hypothetical protein EIN_175610 [Entamoeba invadens IP1]ELP93774.1 hypothetical protein EIN_175610 [Entamoeba invadens IP1]|eukprot:XP_004260545.1 hypothetical protein EIN_175610 [Entamoeba invadens IP1]